MPSRSICAIERGAIVDDVGTTLLGFPSVSIAGEGFSATEEFDRSQSAFSPCQPGERVGLSPSTPLTSAGAGRGWCHVGTLL